MAAEIERLEKDLEEQTARAANLTQECDELKQTVQSRGDEINALRIENTRLEAQHHAAQTRGDEFKTQLDTLQVDFAAAVKAMQQEKPARKRQSKPKSQPEP